MKRMKAHAPGMNPEWKWAKDRLKMTDLNLMKLKKNLFVSYISRWQSLTEFSQTPCAHPLAVEVDVGTAVHEMPLYCFDLTSMPQGVFQQLDGSRVNACNVPCYRQIVNKTLTSSRQYYYLPVLGKHNNPDGVTDGTISWIEDVTGARPDTFPYVERLIHEWSDIRLVMAGAKDRPSRVHVKLVRFKDQGYAPNRVFNNAADFTNNLMGLDNQPATDLLAAHDSFWDSFWGHRITNPIRSIRNQDHKPVYEVMYHRTFDFASKLTNETNTNADQEVFKFFFENNKCYSTERGEVDRAQSFVENADIDSDFGYKAWQLGRGAGDVEFDTNPFVHGHQGVWLMIYGDNFYEKVSPSPLSAGSCPSFDLLVRSKHTIAPTQD